MVTSDVHSTIMIAQLLDTKITAEKNEILDKYLDWQYDEIGKYRGQATVSAIADMSTLATGIFLLTTLMKDLKPTSKE